MERLRRFASLQELREELRSIFDSALRDRERAEVVALAESERLRVERGEVLRDSRYSRSFSCE